MTRNISITVIQEHIKGGGGGQLGAVCPTPPPSADGTIKGEGKNSDQYLYKAYRGLISHLIILPGEDYH